MPNVGPATIGDFELLGIRAPSDLVGEDPYALYKQLQRLQGQHLDPCVCDVLIASVRFMEGAEPQPWWHYTVRAKIRACTPPPLAENGWRIPAP
ncbi:helix-hairpin-helix domain-containing protein [Pseudomarimonas arenosa]|uniref:Mitomycin resistance protein n=1 Tax=Pseudomarimonas arenosa TaxID=2774145 RepID=A0AAW3ZJX3_9GAMM|nr:mitomycin resistance protein [Pseudomarimonas arenosa]